MKFLKPVRFCDINCNHLSHIYEILTGLKRSLSDFFIADYFIPRKYFRVIFLKKISPVGVLMWLFLTS